MAPKPRFQSVAQFMEAELRKTDRARLFVFRQRDKMVARQLQFGVLSDVKVDNLPRAFELNQLEQQFLRARLVLNGEPLLFSFSRQSIVVLDNRSNKFCQSAVVFSFPVFETLVLIGFQASDLAIDYQVIADQITTALHVAQIFETPDMALDYAPPPPPVVKKTDFSIPGFIQIESTRLKCLQQPQPFDVLRHRFGLLVMLSPLFPTFEYNLFLAAELQSSLPELYVAVCVKGADLGTHEKMAARSFVYPQLCSVLESALFLDQRLGKNQVAFLLVDMYPRSQTVEKKAVSDTVRQLLVENDVDYNQQCEQQPVVVSTSLNAAGFIADLEKAFGKEINKRQFWVRGEDLILYGISNKTKQYVEQTRPYSVVLLSRQVNCAAMIQKMLKSANVYVLMQGIFQSTIRQAEKQNEQLANCAVIYDTNSMFRIADDIFGGSGDHVLLFDEQQIQVAADFDYKQLQKIIEEHEKLRLQLMTQETEKTAEESADITEDDI